MKPILTIFISIVAVSAVLIGIGAFYWDAIDAKIADMYTEQEEEFKIKIKKEKESEPPVEEDTSAIEEENAQNLLTLALNSLNEDPRRCWQYLEQVVQKDPYNLDARIFRAQILEEVGKPSMAHEEYLLAGAENSHSKLFVDQYACYLMRIGRHDQAFEVITSNLGPEASADIWLQALFLSKAYKPVSFDWSKHRIPPAGSRPLVRYLVKLPQDKFWNDSAFQKVAYSHDFAQNRQATYWLQLFELLNEMQESQALELMTNNSFASQSWNPQLEINLLRILNYRKNRTLQIDEVNPLFTRFKKSAQRTTQLTFELHNLAEKEAMSINYKISNPVKQFLISDEIFTLAIADANWDEAAIRLHRSETYPSSFPKWAARRYTEALKQNRGNLSALEFAEKQNKTPELEFLIAEMLLLTGEKNRAAAKLHTLSQTDDPTAFEAARLLAETYIRDREFQQAREFIGRTPALANHTRGQELLARTFIEEKQPELAHQIYLSIQNDSPEAKSFLARDAYIKQDWENARRLTEQLITQFPNNEQFKHNLEKIKEKSQR